MSQHLLLLELPLLLIPLQRIKNASSRNSRWQREETYWGPEYCYISVHFYTIKRGTSENKLWQKGNFYQGNAPCDLLNITLWQFLFLDIWDMILALTVIIWYLFWKLKISYILIKGGTSVFDDYYDYDGTFIELCCLPYMLMKFICERFIKILVGPRLLFIKSLKHIREPYPKTVLFSHEIEI